MKTVYQLTILCAYADILFLLSYAAIISCIGFLVIGNFTHRAATIPKVYKFKRIRIISQSYIRSVTMEFSSSKVVVHLFVSIVVGRAVIISSNPISPSTFPRVEPGTQDFDEVANNARCPFSFKVSINDNAMDR